MNHWKNSKWVGACAGYEDPWHTGKNGGDSDGDVGPIQAGLDDFGRKFLDDRSRIENAAEETTYQHLLEPRVLRGPAAGVVFVGRSVHARRSLGGFVEVESVFRPVIQIPTRKCTSSTPRARSPCAVFTICRSAPPLPSVLMPSSTRPSTAIIDAERR